MELSAEPSLATGSSTNLLPQIVRRVDEVEQGKDQPEKPEHIVGRTRNARSMPHDVDRLPVLLA